MRRWGRLVVVAVLAVSCVSPARHAPGRQPPPGSALASSSQAASLNLGASFGLLPAPPRAKGALPRGEASAAERAVRLFWGRLGAGDFRAAARAIMPAQRSCFLTAMNQAPRYEISALRDFSARAEGTGHAAVLFKGAVRVRFQGRSAVVPAGAGGARWLAAAVSGGSWRVDLRNGPDYFPFSGPCEGA